MEEEEEEEEAVPGRYAAYSAPSSSYLALTMMTVSPRFGRSPDFLATPMPASSSARSMASIRGCGGGAEERRRSVSERREGWSSAGRQGGRGMGW